MPGQNPRDDEDLERLKWARAELEPCDDGREVKQLDAEIAAMEEPSQEETEAIVAAKQEMVRTERCKYCHGTGHPPDWKLLGNELRQRRVLAGVSLRQAARDAGMSGAHLSYMERGKRSMGGPKAELVLDRFDLTVENAFTSPLAAWDAPTRFDGSDDDELTLHESKFPGG